MTKHFIHLMEGTVLIGDIAPADDGHVIIKEPYTIKHGKMFPYMQDIVGDTPRELRLHPVNILWCVALGEFPKLEKDYVSATSGIII